MRIRHLHPALKHDVRCALEGLREDPWAGKALQRELRGLYSLRVKHFRILYRIDDRKARLEILTLGPRKTIYEGFTRELSPRRSN